MTVVLKLHVWCALLLAPLMALAAVEGPRTTIVVRPQLMRLAEGGRATIRVAAPEAPLVTASQGRVEAVHEIASGVFEAEYVLPDTLDPQVVVVSAFSSGGFAWTTLQLAGVREVEQRAPHRTLVTATVAGQTYGPIPADASGKAVIRVDVPPGVHTASVGGRNVDLGVTRRGFAHVALDRSRVEASAEEGVDVRVIALDDRGEPMPQRMQVKLEASDGTLTKPKPIAPGVLAARWTVQRGPLRESTVRAQVTTAPGATARAVLQRVAGAPVGIQVSADRSQLVAGQGDVLGVTASVVDAAGNPTDSPAKLLVSVVTGASARMLPDAVVDWQDTAGVYSGRVQVPQQRAGRQQLELRVIGPNNLVGTHTVELLAGPPAELKVEPEEDLYADGRSRHLRVVLLDEYGNRTDAGGPAQITATRGKVGAPTQSAGGVYLVDYSSPLSTSDYEDVVHARVGPIEGQTALRVRARGGTVVLGFKGGYVAGTGGLSSGTGALEVGLWRPSFRPSLGIVLEFRYLSFGTNQTLTSGTTTLPVGSDAEYLAFEPALAWRRPLLGGMFWLGAGPGLVYTSTKVSAPGQANLEASSWVPSAHASVSWGKPLGPGTPFAEVKGGWMGEAGKGAVTGSVTTVTLNVGYRVDVL